MTLATESPSTTRLVVGSRYVLLTLALLFVAGAGAQFFLAGLSLFDTPSHWAEHANLGHKLGIVPWFLWIPAVLGRAVALLRRPTPTRGVAEAPVAGQLERMVRT